MYQMSLLTELKKYLADRGYKHYAPTALRVKDCYPPYFNPSQCRLNPFLHLFRGALAYELCEDFFGDDDPSKKLFEDFNHFDFDEIAKRGSVRDDNHRFRDRT